MIVGFIRCNSGDNDQSATVGATQIVVDESLEPIVEDQLIVFESSYPRASIKAIYKPEVQLLNSFLNDSVDIAIMSRQLRPQEASRFEKRNIKLRVNRFAIDAIALVANAASPDTTITVEELVRILQGNTQGRRLVFDNANSSTVRYLKELAGVQQLPSEGVYALKSNPEVIRHVHNNTGAIGVIGVNWIKQPTEELEPLVENIKILGVRNIPGKKGSDKFYKPSQSNLALGLYPLSRELYIINAQGGPGLGTGFASFLAGERGQRIVLKSGLLPDSIPSREIIIK
ncbi:PstS family phosphate ABC transporter substrate-binding protein [Pedobacter sp. SYSU D00535]|uniref:PstS family phosphate ABC transporter substrate-binding protein n=1 Tax=Pedobacter sp. SYSU D00535 TaxID=2810308 RepID=UPI001F60AB45|nr:substrate-binding domain-containing protein [Pedobacter sp. SYSU D00535]